MRVAYRQRARVREARFGSFSARKKFIVGKQMPDSLCTLAFDSQNTKQAKAAFKLKNQIVTRRKLMWHGSANSPLEIFIAHEKNKTSRNQPRIYTDGRGSGKSYFTGQF